MPGFLPPHDGIKNCDHYRKEKLTTKGGKIYGGRGNNHEGHEESRRKRKLTPKGTMNHE
jgi:hypothetical protein